MGEARTLTRHCRQNEWDEQRHSVGRYVGNGDISIKYAHVLRVCQEGKTE